MLTNTIIRGDSLAILPRLPRECADLVLTDPPYVVGYRDRNGRTIAGDTTTAWIAPAFREIYRTLKDNRFCISFYGWNHVDDFFAGWRRAGFKPAGHIVLIKQYASGSGFLRYQHEQAYLLTKGRPARRPFPLRDVLRWDYTGNRLHPTQKPVSALKPIIGAFSRKGDLVLDPFAGSGSTLAAAKEMGRRYLGIEVNAGYWSAAQQRLKEMEK